MFHSCKIYVFTSWFLHTFYWPPRKLFSCDNGFYLLASPDLKGAITPSSLMEKEKNFSLVTSRFCPKISSQERPFFNTLQFCLNFLAIFRQISIFYLMEKSNYTIAPKLHNFKTLPKNLSYNPSPPLKPGLCAGYSYCFIY